MNKGMLERLLEAGKYQKLAIKTLLPEEVAPHIERIEKELKEILIACLQEGNTMDKSANTGSGRNKKQEKGVKEVTIE